VTLRAAAAAEPHRPWPPEAAGGLWLLAALAAVAASLWLSARLRRWLGRRARVRRAARAKAAERDALGLLEASGFSVVGCQVRQSWGVLADGDELRFTLIADYLVERGGQRWVAEVKTGERALDLRHGPTRRQLLEYREAFGAEGVLLVDAEGGSLRSVRFFGAPRRRRVSTWLALAVGAIAGGVLARLLQPLPTTAPAAAPARRGEGTTRAPERPAPERRGEHRRGGSRAHPGAGSGEGGSDGG